MLMPRRRQKRPLTRPYLFYLLPVGLSFFFFCVASTSVPRCSKCLASLRAYSCHVRGIRNQWWTTKAIVNTNVERRERYVLTQRRVTVRCTGMVDSNGSRCPEHLEFLSENRKRSRGASEEESSIVFIHSSCYGNWIAVCDWKNNANSWKYVVNVNGER